MKYQLVGGPVDGRRGDGAIGREVHVPALMEGYQYPWLIYVYAGTSDGVAFYSYDRIEDKAPEVVHV